MPSKTFGYKNKVAVANLGTIALIFIVGVVLGGGRDGNGVPFFTLGYLILFIVNLVLCIRAFVLKNKSKGKFYLVVTTALILLAFPALMFFLMATGGLC